MKKFLLFLLKTTFVTLLAIGLNGYLSAVHHNLYNLNYDACVKKLIAENNYETQQQAFDCVRDNSTALRVLGTILFTDGSYLE